MTTKTGPKVPWFGSEAREPIITTIKAWRAETGGSLQDWHEAHDACRKCHGRGRYLFIPTTNMDSAYYGKCPQCKGDGRYHDGQDPWRVN